MDSSIKNFGTLIQVFINKQAVIKVNQEKAFLLTLGKVKQVDPHHADLMNDNPFGLHFSSNSQIDSLNSDSNDQNDNPPGTDSDLENPEDLDISSENLVGLDNGPTNTVNIV